MSATTENLIQPTIVRYRDMRPADEITLSPDGTHEMPAQASDQIWIHKLGEHSSDEAITRAAPNILRVMCADYVRRFETGANPLLVEGAVKSEIFDYDSATRIEQQAATIKASIAKGGQYILASLSDPRPEKTESLQVADPANFVGVAKIEPSYTKSMQVRRKLVLPVRPNLFIADIGTSNEGQKHQAARAAILAFALKYGGYQPDRIIATHAFTQEYDANQELLDLGLRQTRVLEPYRQGIIVLAQQLYTTESNGVGVALQRLHEQYPKLDNHEIVQK